jgi:hypothetical protein
MNIPRYPLFGFVCVTITGLAISPAARAQSATKFYSNGLHLYLDGEVEQAKANLRLALRADPQFRPAGMVLDLIDREQNRSFVPAAQVGGVDRKTLEAMTVPVEFRNTDLRSAMEFIRQRVEQVSGGRAQLNFVLNLPPELAARKINLHLDKVPVLEAVRYACALAGVSFQKEPYAIVISPADSALAPAESAPSPTDGAAPMTQDKVGL